MTEVELQAAISRSMELHDCTGVERIEMAPGSDVTNLAMVADVVVAFGDGRRRQFTFGTLGLFEFVFAGSWEEDPRPDVSDIYTVGGPLLVVKEITGDAIVRGILRYLELEPYRG